jgi:hypothetical protein
LSAKNVTVTVASVVVAQAGFINWIQGVGHTYTVAVNAQTDYITVTDDTTAAAAITAAVAAHEALSDPHTGYQLETAVTTQVTFAKSGVLTTTTGAHRWYNNTGRTLTLVNATASVGTAPTGASIKCDVNVDGVTCFVATSQVNRPTIAISGFTNSTTSFDSISTIATGAHYLTVDIDQIGSTIAGSDLTVTIWMTG